MYIFMALLLSAMGQVEEDLFSAGNITSRRLPFPTGDLVWGCAPYTPRVSFDFECSIIGWRAGKVWSEVEKPRDILER
jgi:hypothetical protein